MNNAAVSWKSKKHSCAALCTAEAEYIALAGATQEAIWIRQLLADLNNEQTDAIQILGHTQAAICMAKNVQFHGRAKLVR